MISFTNVNIEDIIVTNDVMENDMPYTAKFNTPDMSLPNATNTLVISLRKDLPIVSLSVSSPSPNKAPTMPFPKVLNRLSVIAPTIEREDVITEDADSITFIITPIGFVLKSPQSKIYYERFPTALAT